MKFSIKILENTSTITSIILNSLKDTISLAIQKSMNQIISETKDIIAESLRQEPEYTSLMSGKLKADLGIPDSASIQAVINALVDTLQISDTPLAVGSSGLKGGFLLTMMKSDDLNGVIYQNVAQVSDSKGYSLPWLEWLLLRSNSALVKNYEVKYGSSPSSRSGMGIMIPSNSDWRVPPEFAGTASNNWTTRAVSRSENRIYQLIKQTIEKHL